MIRNAITRIEQRALGPLPAEAIAALCTALQAFTEVSG
jgi:hypothetical protein